MKFQALEINYILFIEFSVAVNKIDLIFHKER